MNTGYLAAFPFTYHRFYILQVGQPKRSEGVRWHEILIGPGTAVVATVEALRDPLQRYDTDLLGKVGVGSSNDSLIWHHV